MTAFEPVWISTDEHLKTFYAIYYHTPFLEKLFRGYRIPFGSPHMEMDQGRFKGKKVPVVLISSGIGKIDNANFYFQSKPFHTPGFTIKNLMDLEFELSATDFIRVTRAESFSPVVRYFDIPFTRIETKRNGLLENFLVCVGGLGPSMKNINSQSNELRQCLNDLLTKNVNGQITA